jgi:hypothetical protein
MPIFKFLKYILQIDKGDYQYGGQREKLNKSFFIGLVMYVVVFEGCEEFFHEFSPR